MRHLIRHIFLPALVIAIGGTAATSARAGTLWYNGDFNGVSGLAQERQTSVSDARTYDNFNVTGAGWNVTSVWSNDLMNSDVFNNATTAHWEIRSGVSAGNGGTLIASGDSPAALALTGRFAGLLTEYTVEVTGLNINLAPGTYWLSVAPIGNGSGQSFDSTTFGLNAIGTPPGNDGNSFFDSTTFGRNFEPVSDAVLFGQPTDFSMGVGGFALVPEPASIILCGIGAGGLLGYGWRKRRVVTA